MTTTTSSALTDLLETFDFVWDRLRRRVADLDDTEYFWEPAPDGWTVRRDGDRWVADLADPDPDPAPVTTIGWRMWHIAVDCLDGYSDRAFGRRGTGLEGAAWVGDADSARRCLEEAWAVFRQGVADWGEDGARRPLGPPWGRWSEHSNFALALHALDEVAHHGAEIALLRDLYRSRPD